MYKIGGKNLILFCGNFVYHGFVRDLDEYELAARRKKLESKIENGDYFSSMAAIFDILREGKVMDWKLILEKTADDFRYLDENYEIKKKDSKSTFHQPL